MPRHLRLFDEREFIKIALKTNIEREAIERAYVYNDYIENYWKELVQTGVKDKEFSKYKAAVQLAKSIGFAYKTTYELQKAPVEELVARVTKSSTTPDTVEVLLGGIDFPVLTLTDCEEQYWNLTKERLVNKTEFQIRKWKNPRRSSLMNFISVIGDKNITEITRSDILAFKDWWRNKISSGHSPTTANKQIQMLKDILKTVSIHNELNINCEILFSNLKFKHAYKSRPPFEAKYVQDVLLTSLEGLNVRDRHVVYAIADTGARETEIFGLRPCDIFLNDEIPFIWIRPYEMHELKTPTSERQIPLVGAALYAFREFSKGFKHKGNPDVFSNRANKYLTENDLRPTPQHSVYSLRHTMKDRLRDIEAPEEVIDDIMGHKRSTPKYGRGHKLEAKSKWLEKIAFNSHGLI